MLGYSLLHKFSACNCFSFTSRLMLYTYCWSWELVVRQHTKKLYVSPEAKEDKAETALGSNHLQGKQLL